MRSVKIKTLRMGFMAKTKYKEYFELMIDKNKEMFDKFDDLHEKYTQNQDELQEEFNTLGAEIQKIIREWEQKLCNRSEGSGYASFTGNLADKFWGEIRRAYPMIDYIGIRVEKFEVKKVNLF